MRALCAGACVRPDLSLHLCMDFKISKLFDKVVVLEEEKCLLKHSFR